ncbi:uncharacterized protein LOC108668992 [Hyalella azteca]|uniref:Uncharacterized protein LOC108668992 n=1 Tax=Hyalella azteca TaxID=294128 RepID=A0A8B7NDT0_HYAAZ|nr:uncharacterized protein LOC108668992 [Hyalella azteca]
MSSKGKTTQSFNTSRKKLHFLQKLTLRQVYGDLRQHKRGPRLRFFNQLPPRLAFPLAQLAPLSALSAGHIFLGFTKCGQFFLSYTYSCDLDDITLQITHRYRLHWWLVVPYANLRKVAEVMLFGDQDILETSYDNLSITICQWPNDLSKILVYGCSLEKETDVLNQSSNRRCYLTITAVPSLQGCKACSLVATSYEEEEVAERWNTCARLSCLRHGYTVHTSFDVVPPFPRFMPSVQLKYRDWVVLNAGNFIHVLRVSLKNTTNVTNNVGVMLGTSNWNALYQARLAGLQVMQSPRVQDERHAPADVPAVSGMVVEMLENSVSVIDNGSCEHIGMGANNATGTTRACQGSCLVDGGEESSGSDLENDACQDRRILTEADKDREWQILIGNVNNLPPSKPYNVNSGVIDTDSASDVEIGTNEPSSSGGSSLCTVKDINLRFDMLKHGELKMVPTAEATSTHCSNFPKSVITRSQSQQRMRSPQKCDLLPSHMSPSANAVSSSESYSCNDDSDDSTVYLAASASPSRCHCPAPTPTWSPNPSRGRTFPGEGRTCAPKVRGTPGSSLTRWHSDDGPSEPDDAGGTWLRSRTLPRRSSDSTVPHVLTSPTPGNEYEFIDEIESSRHEKLSVFRKRRLADKKYEFTDENSENVPANYRSYRRQSDRHVVVPTPSGSPHDYHTRAAAAASASAEAASASPSASSDTNGHFRNVYERLLSPCSGIASPNEVLRPINPNISSPLLSPRDDRWSWDWERSEKTASSQWGLPTWGSQENLTLLGVSPNHPASRTPTSWVPPTATDPQSATEGEASGNSQGLKCVVDINRCYIEVDDELVSIITDIEDDELSSCTGYHNALPLEVHGTGYTQMHMISAPTAQKLSMPCVKVRQLSLDVEQFCHDTAHQLCRVAGKRYSSCSDYNVEIVDVCSETGNIVAVASVLVQADNLPVPHPLSPHKTRSAKRPTQSPSRLDPAPSTKTRKLFKASSTFVFNINTKQYKVLDQQPLKEEHPFHLTCHEVCSSACEDRWWWQSGGKLARQLRALATHPTSYYGSVKVLTNQPFIRGKSLSHIMEGQHLMAVVLGPIPGPES